MKIHREIERRFILSKLPNFTKYNLTTIEIEIKQNYLITTNGTLRLRKVTHPGNNFQEHWLCTKSKKTRMGVKEVEHKTDPNTYEMIYPLCKHNEIIKTRMTLLGKETWEFDIFKKMLNGLIVAELEFHSVPESKSYKLPEFINEVLVEEITGYESCSNRNLSTCTTLEELPDVITNRLGKNNRRTRSNNE